MGYLKTIEISGEQHSVRESLQDIHNAADCLQLPHFVEYLTLEGITTYRIALFAPNTVFSIAIAPSLAPGEEVRNAKEFVESAEILQSEPDSLSYSVPPPPKSHPAAVTSSVLNSYMRDIDTAVQRINDMRPTEGDGTPVPASEEYPVWGSAEIRPSGNEAQRIIVRNGEIVWRSKVYPKVSNRKADDLPTSRIPPRDAITEAERCLLVLRGIVNRTSMQQDSNGGEGSPGRFFFDAMPSSQSLEGRE